MLALILCTPLIRGAVSLEANVLQKVVRAPAAVAAEARRIYQSDRPLEAKFGALLTLIDRHTLNAFQFYESENARVMDEIEDGLARELGRELADGALSAGLEQNGLWRFDGYTHLPRLTMPQAVLVSPYDSEVSTDDAIRYVAAAPDASLVVFHHSGHHPYLEETASCARQIAAFLSRHSL